MHFKRVAATAGALASIIVVSACSVDGTATRSPIDLDTGTFRTTLAAPAGDAKTDAEMAKVSALRLAEHVVFRTEIDPALTKFSMPTYPIAGPGGLKAVITGVDDLPVVKEKLRYGFSLAGSTPINDKSDKGLNHVVLVFADSAAATEAADVMSAQLIKDGTEDRRRSTTIPGMPAETRALSGATFDGGRMTAAFTPVGDKVIYTWTDAKTDARWTETAVRTAFEKQKALLEGMPPIDEDRRIDPTGIMRAMFPMESAGTLMANSVLVGRAAAHAVGNSSAAHAENQKNGVTEVAVGESVIYRAGGDEQAGNVLKGLADLSGDPTATKAGSPQDLPTALCSTGKSSTGEASAECSVAVGRYAAQVRTDDLKSAQQQISAQYELLKQL